MAAPHGLIQLCKLSVCWRSQAKPSVSKQLTTTIVTNLYRLGVPDKVIQAILRHSNVGVTLGYHLKPQSADVIAAMSRFEAEMALTTFRTAVGQ